MDKEDIKEEIVEKAEEEVEERAKNTGDAALPLKIVFVGVVFAGLWMLGSNYQSEEGASKSIAAKNLAAVASIEEEVIPKAGVRLPLRLGNAGVMLVNSGTIDREKFIALYQGDEELRKEAERLLDETDGDNLVITEKNAPIVLNFFWALGLGNKSPVLEKGPMSDPKYGGAGRFASTGGWTIAWGNAMEHYSAHQFLNLTPTEEALVERVAKNIYRSCCDNSTYFPDCNHGMAMLGFLELMAKAGVSESEMYSAALAVNSYWFPGTYITIAQYFKAQGVDWKKVSPQEVLGVSYSSASGHRNIASKVANGSQKASGGCGVGGVPQAVEQPKQRSGCGVGGVPQAVEQPKQQSGCGVQ